MNDSTQEKSYAPTRRRLREARKRGEVVRSQEVTSALVFIALLALFATGGAYFWRHLQALAGLPLRYLEQRGASDLGIAWLIERAFSEFVYLGLPLLVIVLCAALLGAYAQVRSLFSAEPITPKMERINPALGLKRMFALRNLVELVKMVVKIILLGTVVYVVIHSTIEVAVKASYLAPADIARLGAALLGQMLAWAAVVYVAMAAVDYGHQYYEFMKRQKMSLQELRRELREDEGEPVLKGRRRALAREMAAYDLQREVRAASVVIASARSAVALHYEKGTSDLPKVVAKGQGALAQQICALATQADVPLHWDAELAQRLLDHTQVGEFIGDTLLEAVAQVFVATRQQPRDTKQK